MNYRESSTLALVFEWIELLPRTRITRLTLFLLLSPLTSNYYVIAHLEIRPIRPIRSLTKE